MNNSKDNENRRKLALMVVLSLFAAGCPEPMQESAITQESDQLRQVDARAAVDDLPPILRERFQTKRGRAAYKKALNDKARLANEARRRGYAQLPDIENSVVALEERLIVKHLLKVEQEKEPISDDELVAYFEANKSDFHQEKSVRIARFFARQNKADSGLKRAREFRKALLKKKKRESLSKRTDGPERTRGGDFGWLKLGERNGRYDAALEMNIGEVSEPIIEDDGYSVFLVLDKKAARTPAFKTIKESVKNQMLPLRDRRVFDRLVRELREGAL